MSSIDYKNKYLELKQKFMNSIDVAFRLGYEQGMNEAQSQQPMQAPQSSESQQIQDQPQEGSDESGSELDQHINTLSGLLGKSEFSSTELEELKKSFSLMKSELENKKSKKAIANISKNLKADKLSIKSPNAHLAKNKENLNIQKEIVDGIMKSWAEEERNASKDILAMIKEEGFLKKE